MVEGVPMDRVRDDVLLSHVTARSPQSKCACTVCQCERETTLPVCDPCNFNIHLYKAKENRVFNEMRMSSNLQN